MNQKMLELLGAQADKYPQVIEENFPHVFERLLELWGTADMQPYLDELMMSRRPGRQGFPSQAAAEIWALSAAYNKLYPSAESESPLNDLWSSDTDAARDAWKQGLYSKKTDEGQDK